MKHVTLAAVAITAILAPAAGASASGSLDGVRVAPLSVASEPASSAAMKASALATVRSDRCVTSSIIGSRSYVIRADMYRVSGAASMRVRFRAFRTLPRAAEIELKVNAADKIGYWEDSIPAGSGGVSHLVFYKRLYSLDAPATFRAEVDFEWYSASNRLMRSKTLSVPKCVQPDLRPDLFISAVSTSAVPGAAGKLRYRVTVANQGKGRSAATKLHIKVAGVSKTFFPAASNGSELLVGSIDQAGTTRKATKADPLKLSRTVLVDVDRCTSGAATIEIDPGNLLDESSGENNVYGASVNCSLPSS
jgi:hypothetical protein